MSDSQKFVCSCNKNLQDLYDVVYEEFATRYKNNLSKIEDIVSSKSNSDIFDALNVTKYCCRMHLMTYIHKYKFIDDFRACDKSKIKSE